MLADSRLLHALDGLRKAQDGDKEHSKGTVASIRRGEELDVYLARGCDSLTVEVCPGLVGKDLFSSLKRACDLRRGEMVSIEWPCPILTRHAYGISALCWGGKTVDQMPHYALGAADFYKADFEAFERFTSPSSNNRTA